MYLMKLDERITNGPGESKESSHNTAYLTPMEESKIC